MACALAEYNGWKERMGKGGYDVRVSSGGSGYEDEQSSLTRRETERRKAGPASKWEMMAMAR